MSVTRAELRTRALHNDFDATLYGGIADDAVNDALGIIYSSSKITRADISATVAFAVGVTDATIAGVRSISRVWIDESSDLDYVDDGEFARLLDEFDGNGTPEVWTLTGSATADAKLRIAPAPDEAITVEYVARAVAARMTGDSDVVPLPDEFAWAPALFARSRLFGWEDDTEMSAYWFGLWTGELNRIRGWAAEAAGGSRVVPGTWAGMDVAVRFHYPGLF